jgi:dienelactone hydrolase
MVKRASGKGFTIDSVVYPNAYHSFDIAELPPGWQYMCHMCHRNEYDESAAKDALTQTRRFLDGHLTVTAKR